MPFNAMMSGWSGFRVTLLPCIGLSRAQIRHGKYRDIDGVGGWRNGRGVESFRVCTGHQITRWADVSMSFVSSESDKAGKAWWQHQRPSSHGGVLAGEAGPEARAVACLARPRPSSTIPIGCLASGFTTIAMVHVGACLDENSVLGGGISA